MTNDQLTRERLQEIAEDGFLKHGESKELARIALAAMDSEPVAYADPQAFENFDAGSARREWMWKNLGADLVPLYRHAQPGPERDRVRCEHAEWSHATFGNVGPVGPLKHLSKEALEAAADPGDLSEWADMQFLVWDAQRRAGITDEQITQAMIEKLAVNKQREWPEPKEGEPRLHIKEQPAPIVPDRSIFEKWWESQNGAPLDGWDSLRTNDGYCDDGIDGQFEAWNAGMLNHPSSIQPNTGAAPGAEIKHPSTNSPVIPGGYVMVPKEPTPEMLAVINEAIKSMRGSAATYARVLAAVPQEVNGE